MFPARSDGFRFNREGLALGASFAAPFFNSYCEVDFSKPDGGFCSAMS